MKYDLIIIGGGPAGITAGIYAARQKLNILMITKEFGGQIAKKAVGIENYPGFEKITGKDLIDKLVSHLKSYKINIEKDEVKKIEKKNNSFLVFTNSNKYESLAVIVASGSISRSLGVSRERDFVGRGLSYCALCDGPVFRDKTVAVIGGGNAGFETALFLSDYAKKIYILENSSEIKADKENQKLVEKTGKSEIIINASVKEIKGDKLVSSLIYTDKLDKKKELKVEGVFVEVGYQPATSFVKGLVDLSKRGEIIVEPGTEQTKTAGLFAAGDVNAGASRQIITACGEGAKAVLSAFTYIKKNE